MFATISSQPISLNNTLRRYVFPACQKFGIPQAPRLTFLRTDSSWAHDKGVTQTVLAELPGHGNVYSTMDVHT